MLRSSDVNTVKFFSLQDMNHAKHIRLTQGSVERGIQDEDEILSWSVPKKAPQPPVRCDQPITISDPVMRIPQWPNDVCNPQKSSSKTCAALNNQNKESADATKVVHSAVNGSHLGSKRKDSDTITDAVPLRTIIPVIDDKDDDEIMMWSRPKILGQSP